MQVLVPRVVQLAVQPVHPVRGRLDHRNHARIDARETAVVPGLDFHVAPPFHSVDGAGLEQEPVADGRVPVNLDKALQREPPIVPRFRVCERVRRRFGPDVVGTEAQVFLLVRDADLVLGVGLPRGAPHVDLEPARCNDPPARVLLHRPLGGVVGVLVVEAGLVEVGHLIAP